MKVILTLRRPTHNELIRTALRKTVAVVDRAARRPLTLVIYGLSGVGKSSLALYWAEETMKFFGCYREARLRHLIKEHVCYDPNETMRVLDHALHCEHGIPVFINMEAREALDSRHSQSNFNKKITQAVNLSRAIRPLVLIFCLQRFMDLDIRVREGMNLFAMIRSYIRSDGVMIPPEVTYMAVQKRIVNDGGVAKEIATLQPVRIVCRDRSYGMSAARWTIPPSFWEFKDLDRRKKEELMNLKKGEEIKEAKKFYTTTEVAKMLGVHRSTVLLWLKKYHREIDCFRTTGGEWRISEDGVKQIQNLIKINSTIST